MRFRLPEVPPPQLIATLRGYNLLPAIVFMPTRRRCDESAMETALKKVAANPEKEDVRRKIFQEYSANFPEIRNHKHSRMLVRSGVASHHAGHIPAWKLVVEKMMSAGLLDAIFATTTVAAGVDFPARTVVLSNADTRGNDGWRPLEANELQQMTGRAGRRGKDNVGFVVLAPSNFQNPPRIASLLRSQPDPLQSQFRATYSSLLNLLDAFKSFQQVREIAEKSFAFRGTAHQIAELEKRLSKANVDLRAKIDAAGVGLSIDDVRGFQILTNARNRLLERQSETREEVRYRWLREHVQKGRIVSQGRSGKRFFLVLNLYGDKVSAMRDDGTGTTFALGRINRVYARKYPLTEKAVEEAFYDIYEGKNPQVDEPRHAVDRGENAEAAEILTKLTAEFTPKDLAKDHELAANSLLWDSWKPADEIEQIERNIETLREEVWLPFEHRAKVLHHFGYLDFAGERVTESGKWLADVRVDRPLLVGEALRIGLFERLEPKHVAGLMGSLAADSDRNYGELYLSDTILDTLTEFEEIVFNISQVEWQFGIEPAPEMNFSAAATAESWADGAEWDELVFETKAEEGDLVRLLSRTGEALLQIANLKASNPKAAQIARATAELILREPVK